MPAGTFSFWYEDTIQVMSEFDTGACTSKPFHVLTEAVSLDEREFDAYAPTAGGTTPSEGEQLTIGMNLEVGFTAIMAEQFIYVFFITSNHRNFSSFSS